MVGTARYNIESYVLTSRGKISESRSLDMNAFTVLSIRVANLHVRPEIQKKIFKVSVLFFESSIKIWHLHTL